MFKKIFLLLLMSFNVSASWRFEHTGPYIILLSFVGGAIEIAVRDFKAKIEKEKNKSDEENLDNLDNKQEQSVEDCEKTIKNLEKTTMVILGSLITLFIPELYSIVDDIYHRFIPTEEQNIKNQQEREILQHLIARAKFKDCLFNSDKNSPRDNDFNCPDECKELALAFVQGCPNKSHDEIIKIIEQFDRIRKKQSC
jgi:hypothetical protein